MGLRLAPPSTGTACDQLSAEPAPWRRRRSDQQRDAEHADGDRQRGKERYEHHITSVYTEHATGSVRRSLIAPPATVHLHR
jgi:hypothetical protein